MEYEGLKLNLLGSGTRYQHYSELRDVFAVGIEILKNLTVKSSKDNDRRVKLEYAVEMIDSRLDFLSDRERKTAWGSHIRAAIDEDVDDLYREMKIATPLLDKAVANAEAKNKANNGDDPSEYSTK